MGMNVSGLSFGYRAARHPPVLRDVSFELPAGAVTAVVGPNGAGKTTLLRLMAGVLKPGTGRVELDGQEVSRLPSRARARRVAYMAQRPAVAFAYSVREYVGLGRYASGASAGGRVVEGAIARVDLADRADEAFSVLSAGQQQRAALARVLAQLDGEGAGSREKVLLADEPVSAMDPRHALATMEIMRGLATRGGSVAVVLHDLNLAARFCSHALVLDGSGRAAAFGTAEETLTPSVLEPVFEVRFREIGRGEGPEGRALLAAPMDAKH